MVCPKCNHDNNDLYTKCENCGEQLITKNSGNFKINEDLEQVIDANLDFGRLFFAGIMQLLGGVILSAVGFFSIFKGTDTISKIIGIPFLICGIALIIFGISAIVKGVNIKKNACDDIAGRLDSEKVKERKESYEKGVTIASNLYVFGFLLLISGILIIYDAQAIASWSEGGDKLFFFSLIFWATIIFASIKCIKWKK